VNNFFDSLNPGGYLFIGHSESLTSICDRFETVEIDGVFLYRKPRPRRRVSFDEVLAAREHSGPAPVPGRPKRTSGSEDAVREEALLESGHAGPGASRVGEAAYATVAENVSRAYQLLEEGRPTEAREAADAALALDPVATEALIVRAYTHADDGDLDSALVEVRRVLEIDPLMASAYYILGLIHQRQGDQDAALDAFRRTICVDGDFVLAHFNLANLYKSRGSLEEACREYRSTKAALEASPVGPWTLFLGGFQTDLLVQTCDRSLIECGKGSGRS
jgi:chemotaxis protein methyltransferase CheR